MASRSLADSIFVFVLAITFTCLAVHVSAARCEAAITDLVAFGDELSDDGSGSYAHGLTGGKKIYAFTSWTNGPVAVTYLAQALGLTLHGYAFGPTDGFGTGGATLDNSWFKSPSFLPNGSPLPSVNEQIANYTSKPTSPPGQTLGFIWAGLNDIAVGNINWFARTPELNALNAAFPARFADRVVKDAEGLIRAGLPYVLVANIYPKQRTPGADAYLGCHAPLSEVCQDLGSIVESTNTALKTAVANSSYASRIIYYDVYGFMNKVMDDKDAYGFTMPIYTYCDGDNQDRNVSHWDQCFGPPPGGSKPLWKGAAPFFWFTFNQPNTLVHELIAKDMAATINAFPDASTDLGHPSG